METLPSGVVALPQVWMNLSDRERSIALIFMHNLNFCDHLKLEKTLIYFQIVRHSASTRSLSMSVSKETADTYVYQLHGHQKPFDSSIIRHGTDADISVSAKLE